MRKVYVNLIAALFLFTSAQAQKVSGTINELNPALANAPELVNTDPYGEGWMIKMTVSNPADVDALLDVAGYEAVVG